MGHNEIALNLTMKAMELGIIEMPEEELQDDAYANNTKRIDYIMEFYNDIKISLENKR
jgi:hypothetical protein